MFSFRFNYKIALLCCLPIVDAFAAVLQGPLLSSIKILALITFFGPIKLKSSGYSYLFLAIVLGLITAILIQSFTSTFQFTSITLPYTIRLVLSLTIIHWVYINIGHPVYCVRNWGKNYFILLFVSSFISILGAYALNIGGEIRGRSTFFSAQKGLFIGANEVGLIILLGAFFGVIYYSYIRSKYWKFKRLMILLLTIPISIIPLTKSSLLAGLTLILFYAYNSTARAKFIIISLFTSIIYYNWTFLTFFLNNSFLSVIVSGDYGAAVSRGRDLYADAINSIINNSAEYIFPLFTLGAGFSRVMFDTQKLTGIRGGTIYERDLMDLFIGFGPFISAALYLFLYATISGSGFFKVKFAFIPVILVFGHSIIAGHVLFSSQVIVPLFIFIIYWGTAVKSRSSLVVDERK